MEFSLLKEGGLGNHKLSSFNKLFQENGFGDLDLRGGIFGDTYQKYKKEADLEMYYLSKIWRRWRGRQLGGLGITLGEFMEEYYGMVGTFL